MNYLNTALRNFRKNRFFTAFNIFGLSIGLAACMLISLYVHDEYSYDKFNTNAGNIYRVNNEIKFGGVHADVAQTPALLGPVAVKEIPQVRGYTRLRWHETMLVKKGDFNIRENRVAYGDSTLFRLFSFQMLAGDPETALAYPGSVVVNESVALKYFGRTDIVGGYLTVNDTTFRKITGVIRDIPLNSHFNFDFFLPFSETEMSVDDDWLSQNFNTYLLLEENTDIPEFEMRLNELLNGKLEPDLKNVLGIGLKEFNSQGNFSKLTLTPLSDIHLRSGRLGELDANSSLSYIYIFSVAAFFIMIIACANFMNLSTARSSARAREVGIRKVLGSLRKNLIRQFLTESVLVSLVALIFAIVYTVLLMPFFNELAGKNLQLNVLLEPTISLSFLAIAIITGLLSGIYPAFLLSAFEPADVLKGKLIKGLRGAWLRNFLVVVQFSVSIILIIGTIVIYSQLRYMRNKDIGYDRQQVLIIHHIDVLKNDVSAFRNELKKISGIKNATITGYLPVNGDRNNNGFFTSPVPDAKSAIAMQSWYVDQDYVPTLEIKMLEGRNFSSDYRSDSTAVIVNESAARLLGVKGLMGKKLFVLSDNGNSILKEFRVIGKMRNFNFNSLREAVAPLALFLGKENNSMAVKLDKADLSTTLEKIKLKWQDFQTGQPLDYSFLDEKFNLAYQTEQRMGSLFISFAILAILVATMGLFGLVAYAANQRVREIGIRKILGASVAGIVGMLSFEFFKLILIAGLVSFPLSWWLMDSWLQDFANRITVSWWFFVTAILIVLVVTFIITGFQTIKAALANPVKSLKSE